MSHPRVTEEDLDNAIKKVEYTLLPDGRTTICTLTLDNNFTVRGESSCVSAENFNEEIGQTLALKKARENLWPFLGFRLADKLLREKCEPIPLPEPPYESLSVEAGQRVGYFEVVEGQPKGPMLAFVASINPDQSANLAVLAPNATFHPAGGILVFQDQESVPPGATRYAIF
jgi:hypothetical protein